MVKKVLLTLLALLALAASAEAREVIHVVASGDTVSQVVLTMTGSANWHRAGITVVTNHGHEVSRTKFDRILPGWQVRIAEDLVKSHLIAQSAGKTLAELCEGSADPRCVHRLAKLNGLKRSRIAKPLVHDIYALSNGIPATVTLPAPAAAPTAPTTLAPPKAAVESAVTPAPAASWYKRPGVWAIGILLFAGGWVGLQRWTSEKTPPISNQIMVSPLSLEDRQRELDNALEGRMAEFASRFVDSIRPAARRFGNQILWEGVYDPSGRWFMIKIKPDPYDRLGFPNMSSHAVDFCRLIKEQMAGLFASEPFYIVPGLADELRRNPRQADEWIVILFESKQETL
jgi:hypothetical protein